MFCIKRKGCSFQILLDSTEQIYSRLEKQDLFDC